MREPGSAAALVLMSLTRTPPNPRKPPLDDALADLSAISTSILR